jgi:hypothetical protein
VPVTRRGPHGVLRAVQGSFAVERKGDAMQRHTLFPGRVAVAALCAVLLPGASLAAATSARAAAPGSSWGKAEVVRGLAARNKGGFV